ncbi:tail fiber protein [Bradyrhizobium sp. JR18.2]|uniref:tail fiber protein n=1 Tax=Bradyrhizobium sp. JR18.2 TaxID=3156369 RepID=UPI003398A039
MTAGAVNTWSQTAAINSNVDTTVNWQEGQAPSSVNDSARAMMASMAKYRDDNNGSLAATGTSTALSLTTNQGVSSPPPYGQSVTFVPAATSAAGVTLSVDGGTAYPINSALNVAAPAGTLVSSTPYTVRFDTTSGGQWLLASFFGNPYAIPIGGMIDFTGATAPNSSFVLPYGQAISRTTYAAYYALVSTTYGPGDGLTTFNLPDLRGRFIAGKDDMGGSAASRLTSTYLGSSPTLGATGGGQSHTLTLGELPTGITSTGTVTVASGSNFLPITPSAGSQVAVISSGSILVPTNGAGWSFVNSLSGSPTLTSNNTSGSAHSIVPPTIVLNKILRIV